MEKAIIVYGSTMGNTERLSEVVEDALSENYNLERKDVVNTKIEELDEFDLIIFGSSTWGSGELQEDFDDFYSSLSDLDLSTKKGGVFGAGDTAFPDFCGAVDILEDKLEELGVELIVESFRWDGDITSEAEDEIRSWAKELE
ncbi:flavodoxin domain-containing protein [Orenia marismortui]|uniref:Flavodoxin I n=1 Tax=Orenia marismortui TaxID=46469 RepID=A0A4R8H9C4_9FIRM|nr:flavodoxin domain-containing protein [Orenia marismortui]TDX51654.1 flavodoxin I [Orenia marismortui]